MSDNIILYPVPLVLPGATRFDQLLTLTERLPIVAESCPVSSRDRLTTCVKSLQAFLANDTTTTTQHPPSQTAPSTSTPSLPATPAANPTLQHAVVPVTSTTRHRPSSDTGADLLGWIFYERTLGHCTVLNTDTILDDDNPMAHSRLHFVQMPRRRISHRESQRGSQMVSQR